ncbi:DNA double-strand break repair ATPase Rad50 [Halobaculum sp. MBLA0147]|uniref:DNA double-strand break repair ATPase Rad50 n=1 Tax=Halobaculum sp. MBLA0147 TaxID=3079934 RepID=UPI003523531F
MKFDRIRLRNFKPYGDADVRLSEGVTVIHGLNGSGKSSLLEACFFALYGSAALDGTLEDVITNGGTETDVELWFTHAGESYHLTRELRTYGDQAQTATCTLATADDGEIIRDGATDVETFVAELLRMDAEAFVNCAYVKQGEVNKLIEATPSTRQDMIDDLLQLGKLEEYRDRAGEARLGVEDVLGEQRGNLEGLDDQVGAKEAKDLHEQLNAAESKLTEVDDQIDQYETEKEKAEETREQAQSILDEYEEKRAELADLETEIDDLETKIRTTESEREEVTEEVASLRDRKTSLADDLDDALAETEVDDADEEAVAARRAELEERESDFREDLLEARDDVTSAENRAETLRETAVDLEERAERKRERADETESDLAEARSELEELRERREAKRDERERLRAEFEDAPVSVGGASAYREEVQSDLSTVRGEIEDVRTELNTTREAVERGEDLREAGKCPECGQSVEGSPHVDSLAEERERVTTLEADLADLRDEREALETRLDRAETLREVESDLDNVSNTLDLLDSEIESTEADIEDTEDRIERLREEADELATEATEKRESAAAADTDAEDARERIASINAEIQEITEARERLDRVDDLREERANVQSEIERLSERRDSLEQLNDERRDTLADKRERRDELAAGVDESRVEQARDDFSRADDYVERVTEKLDELDTRRDEITTEIGRIQNELDELEDLRDRRDHVAERVDALERLREETAELETTYGDLRADLRQQNVESLEARLNETFELVYGNDAYSHIELDGQYELTVYQKDGEPLAPDQLSGGERALFNLSLRCGIYRLLAEGVEGAAPTPPLILDEPTVFLDDGHVSRLVDLVEQMRGFGVAQIVIVSHDDELVGAADDLLRVEKNPTTNRSTAERVADASLAEVREATPSDD